MVNEWDSASIVILLVGVLLSGVMGYTIAVLRLGRRVTALVPENDLLNQQLLELKQARIDSQNKAHALEVEQGKDSERISRLKANELRLGSELDEKKKTLQTLEERFENQTEHLKTVEKQLEASTIDNRSKTQKIKELQEDIKSSKETQEKLYTETKQLNEKAREEGNKAISHQCELRVLEARFNELLASLKQEKQHSEDLRKLNEDLTKDNIQLKTEKEQCEASHARELANFEKQKQSVTEQFKVLSNDILEAKTKSLR